MPLRSCGSTAAMPRWPNMAILPARPRKPKDKAKVEAAVLIVEPWLLGRLRHRTFYSLAELNQTIAGLLHQPARGRAAPAARGVGPALSAATACRGLCLRRMAAAPGRHRLPCRYRPPLLLRAASLRPPAGRSRITARTVEIFFKGERIAAHQRMSGNRKHTTVPEHMPSSHRRYTDWTPRGSDARRRRSALQPHSCAI